MRAGAQALGERTPVNILLVDDQPAKLLSYETILAELGENLIRASSGKEALEQLLRTDIAVVLVDVCMPELDGFELASMIRNHPRFQKTAIILVSGVMVEDSDRLKGYDSGAVDYVSVPIVPEILRAKVSVFAELFRKNEELKQLNRELEARVAERTGEIKALLLRAEQARRDAENANRLKDEFLATLSHELRTPLTAITGWAHMLRTGGLDAQGQARAIETINRNAQLQSQLISEILDVSRIITGKLRLSLETVRMRAVIESALDTVRPAAEAKGIQLRADVPAAGDEIFGDPARLQQVVWNLLSNAIKFAPERGRVEIRLEAFGSELELSVKDDGPGIPPEMLPYIFDRFRQGDSSSRRHHHGLGLGLAIVRHLLEMHGGTVHAANRQDRSGAVFTVVLPRRAASSDAEAAKDATESALGAPLEVQPWRESAPSLKGLRVLLVDDDPDAREVVAAMLERCGAEVRVVASAAEALKLLERELPDVIVSDMEMPGQDGCDLLRKVRTLPADRGGRTPAVALTAYASLQDRMKALTAGFQIHLPKPVQPVELATVVASLAGIAVRDAPHAPAAEAQDN